MPAIFSIPLRISKSCVALDTRTYAGFIRRPLSVISNSYALGSRFRSGAMKACDADRCIAAVTARYRTLPPALGQRCARAGRISSRICRARGFTPVITLGILSQTILAQAAMITFNARLPLARAGNRSTVKSSLPMWRRLCASLSNPYRPERHYMRAPGLKWRAKHGGRIAGASC